MFTGLIQALGTITPRSTDSWQITCVSESCSAIMKDLAYGDSVAVDGVCLTVEQVLKEGFIATASPETLRRTTLGLMQRGQKYVNLETSLRVGGKVGGHFVMGHVDGVGRLVSAIETATSWEMTFTAPETVAGYIVPKGSIAVNGVSLTVADSESQPNHFQVAVIPLTYADTNLCHLQAGEWVNLEGDILGKYVEKFLTKSNTPEIITPTFLAEHGYL
ncbi:MAG: riboflavin synthase [Scytonematopsis contorta HA4267-MV1]|nr:riboflavin synthase [Scytonematopsis contorta HA4267-MV1]